MLLPYREDPRSATFGARSDCLLARLVLRRVLVSGVLLVGGDVGVMVLVCSLDRFSAEYQGMIGSLFWLLGVVIWLFGLGGGFDRIK